jgi:hypothetical protein
MLACHGSRQATNPRGKVYAYPGLFDYRAYGVENEADMGLEENSEILRCILRYKLVGGSYIHGIMDGEPAKKNKG